MATIFPSSFQAPMNYTPVDIFNKEKIKRYWVHFTSILQFESKVFSEATLNSIMHNKWTTEDDPSFTMFSDRSEILSIGVLLANKTEEGFYRGDSIPVNKSLAKIVNQFY
ncbi:MAG: hypothetical protein SPI94_02525 [Candidatus Onthovivens sp.]|nr:hypothetical protein [Candidatus Onthovivens sp.]